MTEPADATRADAEARLAAQLRFDAPFVLQAGAGTGKTTVLVARVLAWCLGPGWERTQQRVAAAGGDAAPERVAEALLERVVAITFTEAAAAEMETRMLDAFAAVADGRPVRGFAAERIGVADARQRERASALLAGFDHLRVQTIHAFCRRLLAAWPLEANLHPRFAVDASGAARATAVRGALEARLAEIHDSGDADLEAMILSGVGAPELEELLLEIAGAAVPADRFAEDPLAPERVRAWTTALRAASEAFAADAGGLAALGGRSVGRRVADAARQTTGALAGAEASVEALAAAVDRLRELWPDNVVKRLCQIADDDPKLPGAERDAVDPVAFPRLAAAAARLHVIVAQLTWIDPVAIGRVHRVLAPLARDVARRLDEVGAASFDALLGRARDLLAAHPDVAAAVRAEIDQLLVDEFQDTDRVQCEIVERLALDGNPASRPCLFLVGDPKQSVYGWRSADVGAYLRFVERTREQPGAAVHELCVNYRSVPALLEEVERVIDPVMRAEEGVQPPFQRLVACDERASKGAATPAVEYWWSEAWDAEARAFRKTSAAEAVAFETAHLVADLRRLHEADVAWKDVAILMRATGDLDDYLAALRDAGIPYRVDRDRSYYRRREIRDAIALVCAVLDPNDLLSLVATLRSAWVGVPDAAWPPLWARDFPDLAREALDGDAASRARLRAASDEVARQIAPLPGVAPLAGWETSLLHAIDVLASLRAAFSADPADAFVEALRVRTAIEGTEAARYPGGFRVANLARFFRELAELFEEHAGEVAPVLRELRRVAQGGQAEFYAGRPKDPEENAVQVMTIHGAKGLDFEHVYVVQTHKASGGRERPFDHDLRGDRLEWQIATGELGVATLGWGEVVARRDQVTQAESVRTLYVALTRAKSRVVIAGRFDAVSRANGSHAGWIWSAREPALAAARERLLAARASGTDAAEDQADGARVRWLALAEAGERAAPAADRALRASLDRVRADAEKLAACDVESARRMRRALLGRASEKLADDRRERAAWRGEGEQGEAPDREADVAAVVGTALHRMLERFDWSAPDGEAEWSIRAAEVRASFESLPGSQRAVAGERAAALLAALAASECWRALRALAPDTLARELPVLIGAERDGAAGAVVGAIDWIYWDRERGEPVVVDFKTDRVQDDAQIEERLRAYAVQAERYRCAAAESLGLTRPPRVELWFLAADRRAVVEGGSPSETGSG